MTSRRIAIVCFLLCACMVIGLGYAALSRELSVSGTAHAGARSDLNVWFVDADIDPDTADNKCTVANLSAATGETKSLTVFMETATMQNVGDKAVAIFTIQNQETVANAVHAKIYDANPTITAANSAFTNPDDFYDISWEFVTFDNTAVANPDHALDIADDAQSVEDLPPLYSVYLIVTVELTQSVIDTEISHAANFSITYTAEAITVNH